MPDWLRDITNEAHQILVSSDGEQARNYLSKRGVNPIEFAECELGYVPSDYQIKKCSEDFNKWSKLYFKDKLVFPIYSPTGEVIGIQVRALFDPETGPRYQQFYCYSQEIFPYFFGMKQALPFIFKTEQVVLVEGVFDLFAVRKLTPNSLAILTSGIPVAGRKFLNRFVRAVTMVTDMDKAGREAIDRLSHDCPNLVISSAVYSEKDPSSLLSAGKLKELYYLLSLASNQVR